MSVFLPPIFKFLTKNDLSKGGGHQAGLVIPNPLAFYFLDTANSSDFNLQVSLFRDGAFVGAVTTRFQKQDWRKTRPGEYRITGGLTSHFRECEPGVLLLMQKPEDPDGTYRFDLFTQGTGIYKKLRATIKKAESRGMLEPFRTNEPSGVLPFPWDPEESVSSDAPKASLKTSRQKERQSAYITMRRLARAHEFRSAVLKAWRGQCAVSGDRMKSPEGRISELEAAHIVPKSCGGPDSVNNGICLNRRLHWAFDRGLWTLDQSARVLVSAKAQKIKENAYLLNFEGQSLSLPRNSAEKPKAEHTEWHRENIFLD